MEHSFLGGQPPNPRLKSAIKAAVVYSWGGNYKILFHNTMKEVGGGGRTCGKASVFRREVLSPHHNTMKEACGGAGPVGIVHSILRIHRMFLQPVGSASGTRNKSFIEA